MFKVQVGRAAVKALPCAGLATILLASCGGGSDTPVSQESDKAPSYAGTVYSQPGTTSNSTSTTSTTSGTTSNSTPTTSTTSGATSGTSSVGGTTVITSSVLTSIKVQNTGTAEQRSIPVTFGQVFAPGAVFPSDLLSGKLSDGTVVPLQVDIKATHPDGSLRHAIISAVLPTLAASQTQTISLQKAGSAGTAKPGATPASLLAAGFTAGVSLNIAGQTYTASADALLKSGKYTAWLAGPVVNEWMVSAPLQNAQGVPHPHLTARFAIRSYAGLNKARVDVTIENDWAYEPGPQNITYDAQVLVGGQSVYSKSALTHYHHARWRKTFWWGGTPQIDVEQDTSYLIASGAIPNYDRSITVSASGLSALDSRWSASNTAPMGPGIVTTAMPMVGGRGDIGPLPEWAAMYLLSRDKRAKNATLGVGDLAGSWPIHYRDKKTDHIVSLVDYPYMTLLGHASDTINPATGKSEAFPVCGGDCTTIYKPDSNHQPSMDYLPYLVTGDYYYLEELQFWANYNLFQTNPAYRQYDKGVLSSYEVRGQAWSLRTLGEVAYITPDSDPMKKYFSDRVGYNLKWYNTTYVQGNPNALGVLDGSGQYGFRSILYPTPSGAQTGLAPWQDDFFTWSVGHLAELGYADAKPLLAWKAKFPVGRMATPGYCWIDGAAYALAVRPSATSPLYSSFSAAYLATMRKQDGTPLVNSTGARYLDQACGSQAQANWRTQYDKDNGVNRSPWAAGEMTGYASSALGYPSNMQPALAVAATTGIANARTAWDVFMKRSIKPDYTIAPQWAIVPR